MDRQKVFIGSMNMDARSKLLNTETGIISPAPAEAVTTLFDTATLPQYAYRVTLKVDGSAHGGTMQGHAADHGKPVTCDHAPGVTTTRRVEVQMLKLLPVESLL